MLDKVRLAKVLALTNSDVDGEALAAVRTANKILAAEELTWEDILSAVGTTVNITLKRGAPSEIFDPNDTPWVAPHLKDKVTIDLMFRAIYAQPRGDHEEVWQFLDSIHNRYQKHHNLTANQYAALRRCYLRTIRTGV